MLANLSQQREEHTRRHAKKEHVEAPTIRSTAGERGPRVKELRVFEQDENERRQQEYNPDRLRPGLQLVDQGHAEENDRDDHQGTHEVTDDQIQPEGQLKCLRPDRSLDGEENEGERGVDQRRDGRADVAESGAAGQQVDVHVGHAAPVGDRQAHQEDHQRYDQHGRHGVLEPEAQRDARANGFEGEERYPANRGVGHDARRPSTIRTRRVTQSVILKRLVGHPGLVFASDSRHRLGRSIGGCAPQRLGYLIGAVKVPLPNASGNVAQA